MQANDEPVDTRVRRRLRELRTERGLTLAQVAERASIDLSTLSRLEAGKRRLALDHLPRAGGSARRERRRSARRGGPPEDPRVRSEPQRRDGLTLWPLTRRSPAGLHVYRAVISAKRNQPPAELRVHGGHDWLFVLSGRMRLVLSDHEHVIEPGEAVEFSTWTPHWFGAIDGPVELILIVGHEGEQAHLQ